MPSYAENYLKAYGTPCTILRAVPIQSFVSMRNATRAIIDLAARESYFEGLILTDAGLVSGDIIRVGNNDYIIQSVIDDFTFGEKFFYAVKSNMTLTLKKPVKNVDANKNVIVSWQPVNSNITAYVEVVNYRLRQSNAGLLEQTLYIAQLPKLYSIELLYRIVFNSNNKKYQVESIDDVGLQGIVQIQLSADRRPD